MVALKNINSITNPTESEPTKNVFQEPDGMMEIDLKNVVSDAPVKDKSKKKIIISSFKPPKRLLKYLFYAIISLFLLIVIVLTVRLSIWSKSSNTTQLHYSKQTSDVQPEVELYLTLFKFFYNTTAPIVKRDAFQTTNLTKLKIESEQNNEKPNVVVEDFGPREVFIKRNRRDVLAEESLREDNKNNESRQSSNSEENNKEEAYSNFTLNEAKESDSNLQNITSHEIKETETSTLENLNSVSVDETTTQLTTSTTESFQLTSTELDGNGIKVTSTAEKVIFKSTLKEHDKNEFTTETTVHYTSYEVPTQTTDDKSVLNLKLTTSANTEDELESSLTIQYTTSLHDEETKEEVSTVYSNSATQATTQSITTMYGREIKEEVSTQTTDEKTVLNLELTTSHNTEDERGSTIQYTTSLHDRDTKEEVSTVFSNSATQSIVRSTTLLHDREIKEEDSAESTNAKSSTTPTYDLEPNSKEIEDEESTATSMVTTEVPTSEKPLNPLDDFVSTTTSSEKETKSESNYSKQRSASENSSLEELLTTSENNFGNEFWNSQENLINGSSDNNASGDSLNYTNTSSRTIFENAFLEHFVNFVRDAIFGHEKLKNSAECIKTATSNGSGNISSKESSQNRSSDENYEDGLNQSLSIEDVSKKESEEILNSEQSNTFLAYAKASTAESIPSTSKMVKQSNAFLASAKTTTAESISSTSEMLKQPNAFLVSAKTTTAESIPSTSEMVKQSNAFQASAKTTTAESIPSTSEIVKQSNAFQASAKTTTAESIPSTSEMVKLNDDSPETVLSKADENLKNYSSSDSPLKKARSEITSTLSVKEETTTPDSFQKITSNQSFDISTDKSSIYFNSDRTAMLTTEKQTKPVSLTDDLSMEYATVEHGTTEELVSSTKSVNTQEKSNLNSADILTTTLLPVTKEDFYSPSDTDTTTEVSTIEVPTTSEELVSSTEAVNTQVRSNLNNADVLTTTLSPVSNEDFYSSSDTNTTTEVRTIEVPTVAQNGIVDEELSTTIESSSATVDDYYHSTSLNDGKSVSSEVPHVDTDDAEETNPMIYSENLDDPNNKSNKLLSDSLVLDRNGDYFVAQEDHSSDILGSSSKKDLGYPSSTTVAITSLAPENSNNINQNLTATSKLPNEEDFNNAMLKSPDLKTNKFRNETIETGNLTTSSPLVTEKNGNSRTTIKPYSLLERVRQKFGGVVKASSNRIDKNLSTAFRLKNERDFNNSMLTASERKKFKNGILRTEDPITLSPKLLVTEEDGANRKSVQQGSLSKQENQNYMDTIKREGENRNSNSSESIITYSNKYPFKQSYSQTRLNWHDQNPYFNQKRTKDPDFSQGNNPIHTNQQNNGDFNKPTCPVGFSILQQTNPYPLSYPTNPIIPYQTGVQYPYSMPQPYPYQNVPQLYANTPLQQNPYFGAQSIGHNGQFFVCSPMPSTLNNQLPQFEIRKGIENMNLQQRFNPDLSDESSEETRSAPECPYDQVSCNDGSKCIKQAHFCDGEVHCKDASDELSCTCKDRIDKSRLCDGYFDCPNGEDELRCFGCEEDSFSCDDWSFDDRTASCIPIEQRCDGIRHCPTGKDEEKCTILTNRVSMKQSFIISSSFGYLYRNYKGRWYPTCRNPEMWASEACRLDAGPNSIPPLVHLIPVERDFAGQYATMTERGYISIVDTCEAKAATYVQCPPLICGTRIGVSNPYRREEVDTSVEEMLSRFSKSKKKVFARNSSEEEDAVLGDSRVVGGKQCQPESWPWIVSVYRNGVFHCGGVLINENWILTAAHCVDKYYYYYYEIQAGVLRRYSYAPMVQNRMISNIIAHQYYDRAKLKNDIALMKLDAPVEFNRYIRPACLPSEITAGRNYMWNPKPGTICSAIGWGAMVEHGSDPDHLREVEVPVLKNCKHREDKEGNEICAGLAEGGKDACQGDSGGPFMCRNPNVPHQWYLAGIVSHGEGCARPNEPGVYTRVSLYVEWIFENTRTQLLPQTAPLRRCPGYVCKATKRCLPKKRHCDKIVDCLEADDEVGCDTQYFNEIFKHAMRHMFFRSEQDLDKNETMVKNQPKEDADGHDEFVLQQTAPTTEILRDSATGVKIGKTNTTHFVCKDIVQTISFNKKCDNKVDCEDATDEEGCLCVDYLKWSHPDAICDGLVDCYDYSDEQNCSKCQVGEFYCRHNNTCISITQMCDGITHCLMGEDEADCFALTDGKTIELDADSRPAFNNNGIVTFMRNGTWKVVCNHLNSTEATYASHLCLYLGFTDYKRFFIAPELNELEVIQNGVSIGGNASGRSDSCLSLYIRCSDGLDVNYRANDVIPWNAEIYVNGHYKCMGTLIENQWVVTSKACFGENFKLMSAYVAVLLGGRKTYLDVMGSYEEILRAVEYLQIPFTDFSLLRLERNATLSRYIQPIKINVKKNFNVNEKQTCMAIGKDEQNRTKIVNLSLIRNCTKGKTCFIRSDALNNSCESQNHWIGTIVCRSTKGWYPNAVFSSAAGLCGFTHNSSYFNIQFWKGSILRNLIQSAFIVNPPHCNGFRCALGNCIETHQVCDGILDCRSRIDEDPKLCLSQLNDCRNSSSCACKPSEMKCKNGKCVPKSKFCNKIDDCGDSSDEPEICNCKSYLELTNENKICDGIRNCEDRSDEDPLSCQCSNNMYKCEETNYCVSKDVVCDQVPDCPNNDDEMNCLAFVTSAFPNEVYYRTSGVWHPGCFPERLTTLELENLCSRMGYIGGSAERLTPYNESVGWSYVTHEFPKIKFQRDNKTEIAFGFRNGDEPFVTFKPSDDCYRLFLQCL